LNKVLPAQTGFLAARFYVYVPTTLTDTTTLLVFSNSDTSVAFSVAGGFDSTHVENGHWKLHSTADFYGPLITLGAWQCVELDVDLATFTMQLFVTDAVNPDRGAGPIVAGSVPTTVTPGPFHLGVYSIPTTATADVWFDDVAVAKQHIGCE
jgi:hypothetical protein